MIAQVCAVNETLLSVSKLTKRGNKFVFDDAGSCVENKATGQRTWMTEDGGMYTLKMRASRQSTAEAGF